MGSTMADRRFPSDAVTAVLKRVCEEKFRGVEYDQRQVNDWANDVTQSSLEELQQMGRPFKYIVNAVILQKSNAGINIATSVFWQQDTDGSATYRFETNALQVIMTCYGLAV